MTRTRVVEYVHEYDEPAFEHEGGVAIAYTSHSLDTHYAVAGGGYSMTGRDGKVEEFDILGGMSSWAIDGTNLTVYNENDIDGLIGLLEVLREQIRSDAVARDGE